MQDALKLGVQIYLKEKLDEKGFSETSHRSEPTFGFSDIVFSSDKYWLRIENDRGDMLVQLGRLPMPRITHPFEFTKVCEFLKLEDLPNLGSDTLGLKLQHLSKFIIAHWDEIFCDKLINFPR